MEKKTITFAGLTSEDHKLIQAIVKRAIDPRGPFDLGTIHKPLSIAMDISACHLNGCPLNLADFARATDFNFAHDLCGIIAHIDRATGELQGFFRPRFAVNR